jgi:hypothetical protein
MNRFVFGCGYLLVTATNNTNGLPQVEYEPEISEVNITSEM